MIDKNLFDRVVLIIIDQLRADYKEYFVNCKKLLPYSAICDTNSIPASTEAMHANISTGKYPKEHGFISKSKIQDIEPGESGLEQMLALFGTRKVTPLSSLAVEKGYDVVCIGSKQEAINVIGVAEDCAMLVFAKKLEDSANEKLECTGIDIELKHQVEGFLKEKGFDVKFPHEKELSINNKTRSDLLIDLFRYAMTKITLSEKRFEVLALPSLDYLGHKHGPHTAKTLRHLNELDQQISEIILSDPTALFVIVGDHGCRRTQRYLVEKKRDNPFFACMYHQESERYKYLGDILFDANEFRCMSYDGGILRVWLKNNADLSEKNRNFLAQYGTIIDLRSESIPPVENKYLELINNSRHTNLGHIVVVSDKDVTFCKNSWIDKDVLGMKISANRDLEINELPIGEHGTYYPEDRHTLFMSNHDFKKDIIPNSKIREELDKLISSH